MIQVPLAFLSLKWPSRGRAVAVAEPWPWPWPSRGRGRRFLPICFVAPSLLAFNIHYRNHFGTKVSSQGEFVALLL